MLDFTHLVPGGSLDQQLFVSLNNLSNLTEWQTWRKPRGKNWLNIIAVGGGASGGCGINTTTTSGGGAGGGGGGYSSVTVPMYMLPDVLYIQCGKGGAGANTSGYVPAAGSNTVVSVEPYTTLNGSLTFAFCNGAPAGGSAATSTTGGLAGSAAAAATASQMVLGVRAGTYILLAGIVGTAGGASTPTAGVTGFLPTTGNICCGGTGAGGTSGTAAAGGLINLTTNPLGSDYLFSVSGGVAGSGATPAGSGQNGFMARNYFMSYPGSGGGAGTSTAGGNPGAGGNGGLGSGGGGAGGTTSTNPQLQTSGVGGSGFVLMTCF